MAELVVNNGEDVKSEEEKAIWATYEAGGNFAHNMVSIELRMFADKYGKEEADRVYQDLVDDGF